MPLLGLWVERPTVAVGTDVHATVVSPVPWCPPLPPLAAASDFTKFRRVPKVETRRGVEVLHPRFAVGPGGRLLALEARTYMLGVRGQVRELRRRVPFDLIHAHFTYPDGVVAVALGQRYRVPVVVTEHAPWLPWMDASPAVRKQAVAAAAQIAAHIAVSSSVRDTIVSLTGDAGRVRVVPNAVDEGLFRPAPAGERDPHEVLYVGMPRSASKGMDVLFDAMTHLFARHPTAHLTVVGGPVYRDGKPLIAELEARAARPPLAGRVTFTGPLSPPDVARRMARSGVLVLPSQLESFGAVLIEALACGTPVVSTRCGGPEDIVVGEVGRLVPVGDPPALADALATVIDHPGRYPADVLREYAVSRYGLRTVAAQLCEVYRDVLNRQGGEAASVG